jgi:hypothetical protein
MKSNIRNQSSMINRIFLKSKTDVVEATTSTRKDIVFQIDCGFGEYKYFEIDENDYQAVE